MRQPHSALALALLLTGTTITAAALPPVHSVELRGSTVFIQPPWKVELLSYTTTVGQTRADYFFTVELAPNAGAALAELLIRQTRGVDNQFQFNTEQTRAFLGRPRREGRAIPVEAQFDQRERLVRVRFAEPVEPGSTVTVRLRPWTNPQMADTYMFQVTALPAGPNPTPAPLGFGTLRIYQPDWR